MSESQNQEVQMRVDSSTEYALASADNPVVNRDYTPDDRDGHVIACVETEDAYLNWQRLHAEEIYTANGGFVKGLVPSIPARREDPGHVSTAGYVGGNKHFPVAVDLTYYKTGKNGKYIVYWTPCGRYADFIMLEQYVKARFVNCKLFTDSKNEGQMIDLFQ